MYRSKSQVQADRYEVKAPELSSHFRVLSGIFSAVFIALKKDVCLAALYRRVTKGADLRREEEPALCSSRIQLTP